MSKTSDELEIEQSKGTQELELEKQELEKQKIIEELEKLREFEENPRQHLEPEQMEQLEQFRPQLRQEMLEEEKKQEKEEKNSIIKELLTYAIIFVLCVFIVPRYVVQKTIVDGESMENALQNRDHLLVEKVSYRFSDPERFDIAVFFPYGKEIEEYYVKRVIALPGETIQIKGDKIYIDGELLEESFGKQPIQYAGIAEQPLTLGEDEFFLMGDNRENSYDSRYQDIGPIKREDIEGHAFLRIWPLKMAGFLNTKP